MSENVTFLHTGDLHLGRFPDTEFPEDRFVSEPLIESSFRSFRRLVEFALDNSVDFVLISGDLFSRQNRSVRVFECFVEQMERLAGADIPCFAVQGNTDLVDEILDSLEFPDTFHLFPAGEPETVSFESASGVPVQIAGISYREKRDSRSPLDGFDEFQETPLSIGLLHTALDPSVSFRMPCTKEELSNVTNVDYWALGHRHDREVISRSEPAVIYPGSLQGNNFEETGVHGGWLVEAETDASDVTVRPAFVPCSSTIFQTEEISFLNREDDPEGRDELMEILLDRLRVVHEERTEEFHQTGEGVNLEPEPDAVVVRWSILGTGSFVQRIQEDESLREDLIRTIRAEGMELDPVIWTDTILARCEPGQENKQSLIQDDSVIGEFFEMTSRFLAGEEEKEKLEEISGPVWFKREDHEEQGSGEFPLTEEMMNSFVEDAKRLVVEEIMKERNS